MVRLSVIRLGRLLPAPVQLVAQLAVAETRSWASTTSVTGVALPLQVIRCSCCSLPTVLTTYAARVCTGAAPAALGYSSQANRITALGIPELPQGYWPLVAGAFSSTDCR